MSDATLWAGVALLGSLGSLARFWLDGWVQRRLRPAFPLGTLTVNLIGTFLLGFLVGLGARGDAMLLLGVGFLGSFTTFSTWMFETQRLIEEERDLAAVINVAVSLAGGLAAALAGLAAGARL